MRRTGGLLVFLVVILIACGGRATPVAEEPPADPQKELEAVLDRVHWLGHDAFWIDAPPIIYLDPYNLGEGTPEADLVLITHDHADHCSPADVARIQGDDTTIVTVAAAASMLRGDVQLIEPGDTLTVKGIEIEAVPAYNLTKFRSPGVPYHPKESGYVGFVITVGGQRIYHAGDTDHIPEMAELGEIDIAMLPVGGTYVMTAEEAVEAAEMINPQIAIPMHVGRTPQSLEFARAFEENATVEVRILEIE
jgi:L-ascorbate metabolism protein UlaG (beta-lactamase superfamily)